MIPDDAMPVVRAIRACFHGCGKEPSERGCIFWWGSFAERFRCSTLAMNTFANWLQEVGFREVIKALYPIEKDNGHREAPLDPEDTVTIGNLFVADDTPRAIGVVVGSLPGDAGDDLPIQQPIWIMKDKIASRIPGKDGANEIEMARCEAVRLGFLPPALPS